VVARGPSAAARGSGAAVYNRNEVRFRFAMSFAERGLIGREVKALAATAAVLTAKSSAALVIGVNGRIDRMDHAHWGRCRTRGRGFRETWDWAGSLPSPFQWRWGGRCYASVRRR
jgi:hexokinase